MKILKINNLIRNTFLISSIIVLSAMTMADVSYAKGWPPRNTSYLDSLDKYLSKAASIADAKLKHLEHRRDHVRKSKSRHNVDSMLQIGKEYEILSIDSALAVYDEGESMARHNSDRRNMHRFMYRRAGIMPIAGLAREGIELFQKVPITEIYPGDKVEYFDAGHRLYRDASDYYTVDSIRSPLRALSHAMADSAFRYLEPGSPERDYYEALTHIAGTESSIAIAELTDVMERVDISDPLFAKASAAVAHARLLRGEDEEARYYLAVSAIGDIMAGNREITSLQRLGQQLYDEGDYQRAYQYMMEALRVSMASGTRLRVMETARTLPIVIEAGDELEHSRHNVLLITMIVVLCLFVASGVLLALLWRNHRRLQAAREHVLRTSDSKDAYIRKMITLCGTYLDIFDNFNRMAARKIKVGQTADLLRQIESEKNVRDQLQDFYDVFDESFLSVYPDFVAKVNELLLPDKKLSATPEGKLNTELRLLAFMRLGIDDSAQIARFLGLSLNSVYTYRNKLRTRAKNRADFEIMIRNIS